jgi:hypothetical protein
MPPRKSKITDKKPETALEQKHISASVINNDNSIELVISTVHNTEHNNDNVLSNVSHVNTTGATVATDLVTPEQFQKGHVNKKRGRKPKGGKIMTNISTSNPDVTEIPNIILHLKCHMDDLKTHNDSISNYQYCPSIEEVQSYIPSSQMIQCSDIINNNGNQDEYNEEDINDSKSCIGNNTVNTSVNNVSKIGSGLGLCVGVNDIMYGTNTAPYNYSTISQSGETNTGKNALMSSSTSVISSCSTSQESKMTGTTVKTHNVNDKIGKEIMKKIHKLKLSFHNSEPVQTKGSSRSACFWDTCDFDTQIYFIPTSIINDTFQVYGCFCSPECAIAYLLKEHIDTSTKFERLHLIQLLYGGIYQYGKGLKPAPSPHFLLDKYYGNLSIQEYRQLLKGTQMIYVVNKPLTHILPELYEDNNDFLVNSKVIPTNNMKLKKRYKTMIVQNQE